MIRAMLVCLGLALALTACGVDGDPLPVATEE